MESENTNANEGSNTVTENAPDMNEFQQAPPVEEGGTTEEVVNNETTAEEVPAEATEKVTEETQEVQNPPENSNDQEPVPETENTEVQESAQETADAPPETQETADASPETQETAETVETPETADVPPETQETQESAETPETPETTDAPPETQETAETAETKETQEEVVEKNGEEETTTEVQNDATQEQNPVTNNTEEATPTTQENNTAEVEKQDENVDAVEQNKESLMVEEVTPEINNNDFSEMDNAMTDQIATEEAPITEITNSQEHQATETFEEQVNTIPNEYYSPMNTSVQSGTGTKTSVMKPVGVENYKFSSEPRAIPAPSQRRKYRDPYELEKMLSIQKNEFNQEKQRIACNIMYDPRVVRGNTYAAKILPLHSEPDPLERHKQEEMKRRAKARKRAAEKRRIKTPEPVEGRRHVEIQTDLYLEELYDKVPEAIAATQTDLFLDRAPSPLYIPQKSGIDAATQIYDGELFDFNFEVEPILEVLVGKTLEQALIEVMEEEELEMLRKHQIDFEEKRNAELAEVQRLEEAERRRNEEKNRRIAEKLKLMEEKKEVAEKIAARSFTNSYLSNLIPSVFETLNDNGFFYDPRETEIENYFLPWLTHKSNNYVDKIRTSRLLLDHIILDSIKQLNDMGRPILRGLKERKIKKSKVNVSVEDWLNPDNTFKCAEYKAYKY